MGGSVNIACERLVTGVLDSVKELEISLLVNINGLPNRMSSLTNFNDRTGNRRIYPCSMNDIKQHLGECWRLIINHFDSFLQQRDSWSRIEISSSAFVHLADSLHIFKPFWGIVQGFGLKTESQDENLTSINSSISSQGSYADG